MPRKSHGPDFPGARTPYFVDAGGRRRAAAIEGVGMMLGRSLPLSLMDVSRQANYTVFNEWMDGLYQTTL